jgi:hypothetical protein
MSKEIKKNEFYTPEQAAKRVGTAPKHNSAVQMIQRHIRLGELKAKNVGNKDQPRCLIRGKHLQEYKKKNVTSDDYKTK